MEKKLFTTQKANILISDFNTICRVCLKFTTEHFPISLYRIVDMMTACTSVQIWSNDDLPNQLCDNCFTELQNSYKFRQLAENSDLNLRNILKENILKTKNDNITSNNHAFMELNETDLCESDSEKDDKLIKIEIDQSDVYLENKEQKYNKLEEKDKYYCDECDFMSDHLQYLELHLKRYHKKPGKPCSKCNKLFYYPLHLEKHEITHRKSRNRTVSSTRVPCDVCGKRILKRELKRHLQIHTNDRNMIQCTQCDKKFLHQSSLKVHIQRYHENKPREYKHLCTICGKKFGTKNDLDRHGSVHRNDRPYNCPHCGKGFKLNHNLKSHIKQIHLNMRECNRIACKICDKLISKTNMKSHLQVHKAIRDVYTCTQCSKQFLHQFSLEQHVKNKHEKIARERHHLCNMCGKGFNTRTELKTHMLSHSDERTFECQTCGMKYKTAHGLRYHTKSVHLNLKLHSCPVCLRYFTTRGIVERHMRTHTGERPFSCTLCEKSFNQKSTLTTHLRLVHST